MTGAALVVEAAAPDIVVPAFVFVPAVVEGPTRESDVDGIVGAAERVSCEDSADGGVVAPAFVMVEIGESVAGDAVVSESVAVPGNDVDPLAVSSKVDSIVVSATSRELISPPKPASKISRYLQMTNKQ